jgi:uncharacterized membrane protein
MYGPDGPIGQPTFFYLAHIVGDLLIVAAVIIGIVLLVRYLSRRPLYMGARGAALTELEMRYARGEINREDFLQRRADLLAPHPAPPTIAPPPPATPG